MRGDVHIGLLISGCLWCCSSHGPHGSARDVPGFDTAGSTSAEPAAGGAAGSTASDMSTGGDTSGLPGPGDTVDPPCNGDARYCTKRYDEFCQVASRDAAANDPDFWQHPAQDLALSAQLQRSVRALMLELHSYQGGVSACRGDCAEGNVALAVALQQVVEFFAGNPREVLTLLLDTTLDAETVAAEFVAKGLDAAALVKAPEEPWPTLGSMLDAGTRLVVFANAEGTGPSWLLPRDTYLWETGSNWTSLSSMSCNPAVGDASRPMYVVHHDLVAPADGDEAGQPSAELALEANVWKKVTTRLQACAAQFERVPNFVAVDYFELGDPTGAAQVMNGVRAAP